MPTFFTPGPAQLYPTFEQHLHTAVAGQVGSISHRSGAFRAIYQHAVEQLRQLLSIPADRAVLFTGSATEIWERVVQNCAEHETAHFVNGSFSKRFHETALELGRTAHKAEAPFGKGFEVALHPLPDTAELICLTHNETSSGVAMSEADIHSFRRTYPGKIIAVDMVSSAPYPALDWNSVDTAFFSVQKGFGLPAGLGVWIANETCLHKSETLKARGVYTGGHHSLTSLWKNYLNFETPATPNVLGIYLLGKVAEDMNRRGISEIRRETDEKAALLHGFLQSGGAYSEAVAEPAHRSPTVVVAQVRQPAEKINALKAKGLVIGSGYGSAKDSQVRIANFPAVSTEDVGRLLAAMA